MGSNMGPEAPRSHFPRPSLEGRPVVRPVLHQAMAQSLEILQMTHQELAEYIESEGEKNPLLELRPKRGSSAIPLPDLPSQGSLYDFLLGQIRQTLEDPLDFQIAREWLLSLDERGFVTLRPEQIADALEVPPSRVLKVLTALQSMDPPGIFARSLQESLLLQLERTRPALPFAHEIIAESFEDLLHKRYSVLERRHRISSEQLSQVIRSLARFPLRPGSEFGAATAPWARPDVRLTQRDRVWVVEPVEDFLPDIQIRQEYVNNRCYSPLERETVRSFFFSARELLRAILRRRRFIVKLTVCLVKRQSAYLRQTGPLAPLQAAELAELFGVHESTISRALSEKYLETPSGLILLRTLVPGQNNVGAKELLQKLITEESPLSPLTDEQISSALTIGGCKTARRTVAKYRQELNIPSATNRKHLKGRLPS